MTPKLGKFHRLSNILHKAICRVRCAVKFPISASCPGDSLVRILGHKNPLSADVYAGRGVRASFKNTGYESSETRICSLFDPNWGPNSHHEFSDSKWQVRRSKFGSEHDKTGGRSPPFRLVFVAAVRADGEDDLVPKVWQIGAIVGLVCDPIVAV